jgi:hypothetical protein
LAEQALPRDIVLLVDDSPEALGFLTDTLEPPFVLDPCLRDHDWLAIAGIGLNQDFSERLVEWVADVNWSAPMYPLVVEIVSLRAGRGRNV